MAVRSPLEPTPTPPRTVFAPSALQRLRLDAAVARLALVQQFTYRGAALGGLAANFFFGLLRAAVLVALLGDGDLAGYGVREAVSYAALTQAVIAVVAIFGSYDLMRAVHSGEIAGDLLRPLSLYRLWLARDGGRALAAALLRGATLMLLFVPLLELAWPRGAPAWLAFGASLLLAWWVSFNWRFLVNLTAFWSPNAAGIGRFLFFAAMFFSGFLMPLAFFPPWVQRLADATPFPAIIDTVVEVYLGRVAGGDLLGALATQFTWGVALMLLALGLLRLGLRRLVLLGG